MWKGFSVLLFMEFVRIDHEEITRSFAYESRDPYATAFPTENTGYGILISFVTNFKHN